VLDGEQQQIKIGQRVPTQTATIPGVGPVSPTSPATGTGASTGSTPSSTSPASSVGALGFSGIPEIQYQDVGLVLELTPTVYDEEVQVKLKVSSTSVTSTSTLTPTFNQRDVSSVARVRNGQTSLVAAVSQSQESKDIKGLPFLSFLPVIGRLFATPNTSSADSYVVITLTPHIVRKADITDYDRLSRDAGPESNHGKRQITLEEILYLADHEAASDLPVAEAGVTGETPAAGVTRKVPGAETSPAPKFPGPPSGPIPGRMPKLAPPAALRANPATPTDPATGIVAQPSRQDT